MMLVQERFFRRNFPFNTPVLQIKDAQEFGSEEQLRKVTEALKTKAMAFSLGISEPGAGSDSTCIASTATRRDGKVYLNGTKTFITNAAYCPYILFVTRDLDNPNQSAPICEVYFDNVEVEESDIFGKENNGFMQLVKNFELERISIANQSLGQAEYCYLTALEYAVTREQFGKPISSFQLIQDKLAEMRVKIDNMRFQVLQAAWMKDNGKSTQVESGLAKLYNAREAFEVWATPRKAPSGACGSMRA